MSDILKDETTYKILDKGPTKMVKKRVSDLLNKWKTKK